MRYFTGEIDGVRMTDLNPSTYGNFDKYEERLAQVLETIEDDKGVENFLMKYMNEYRITSPNKTDYLSEEDAVCNLISIIATYLLSAKDIESERKIEYKFWKSMRDFRKSAEFQKTINTTALEGSNNEDSDNRVEVVDMFYNPNQRNEKKAKDDWKVTSKDIKAHKEIAELHHAIKSLRSEKAEKDIKTHIENNLHLVEDEVGKEFMKRVLNNTKGHIKKYVADLKENQLAIKKAIDVPVSFGNPLKDEGFPLDWSKVDLSNKKVFRELLYMISNRDMQGNDLQVVLYDLHFFLLNGVKLSERELMVVTLLERGHILENVAIEMGISKGALQQYVSRIMAKVLEKGYVIE